MNFCSAKNVVKCIANRDRHTHNCCSHTAAVKTSDSYQPFRLNPPPIGKYHKKLVYTRVHREQLVIIKSYDNGLTFEKYTIFSV